MSKMLRLLLLVALMGAVGSVFTGCEAFDPYKFPIKPGIDDVHASASEKAAEFELHNSTRKVVILPTQSSNEHDVAAMHTRLVPLVRNVLEDTGRLLVVDNNARTQNAIRSAATQRGGLYGPEAARAIGKSLGASHVAWMTVHSFDASVTKEVQRQRKDKLFYIEYQAEGVASVSMSILECDTGALILHEGASATAKMSDEARPSLAALNSLAQDAVYASVNRFERYIAPAFPVWGYIAELRGQRTVAMVKFDNVGDIRVGTSIQVMKKEQTRDPVKGTVSTRYVAIGSLRVRKVDANGIWCATSSGEQLIRLGHPVVAGR